MGGWLALDWILRRWTPLPSENHTHGKAWRGTAWQGMAGRGKAWQGKARFQAHGPKPTGVGEEVKKMQEKLEEVEEWKEVEEPEREREEVNYVKWEMKGAEVKGKLVDIFEAKDGTTYAKIDTGAELLTMFTAPTLLEAKLRAIEKGKEVRIVYLGQIRAFQSGRKGKDFQVFVKGPPLPPHMCQDDPDDDEFECTPGI